MENNEIIEWIIIELMVTRDKCNDIKLDHTSTIKLVEAKSDILRAINKLKKLIVEEK